MDQHTALAVAIGLYALDLNGAPRSLERARLDEKIAHI